MLSAIFLEFAWLLSALLFRTLYYVYTLYIYFFFYLWCICRYILAYTAIF